MITVTVKHKIIERKTPLTEDLLIILNHSMSQLNLKGYFTAFVFVDGVFFISKLL